MGKRSSKFALAHTHTAKMQTLFLLAKMVATFFWLLSSHVQLVCVRACSDMSNRFFNVVGHGIYRCLDMRKCARDGPCVLIPSR